MLTPAAAHSWRTALIHPPHFVLPSPRPALLPGRCHRPRLLSGGAALVLSLWACAAPLHAQAAAPAAGAAGATTAPAKVHKDMPDAVKQIDAPPAAPILNGFLT